jgi:hypothetical protein
MHPGEEGCCVPFSYAYNSDNLYPLTGGQNVNEDGWDHFLVKQVLVWSVSKPKPLSTSNAEGSAAFDWSLEPWCSYFSAVKSWLPFGSTISSKLFDSDHDGSMSSFHRSVEFADKTLIIIMDSFGNVFGGYASSSWRKRESYSPGTFLFSLSHSRGDPPAKFDLLRADCKKACIPKVHCGPVFGKGIQ